MPRYFFHLVDGEHITDELGTELAGLSEARAHAVETAGQMLRKWQPEARSGVEWHMHVTNGNDATVLRLRFSDSGIAAIGNEPAGARSGRMVSDPAGENAAIAYGKPLSREEARLVLAFRAIAPDEIRNTILQLLENVADDAYPDGRYLF